MSIAGTIRRVLLEAGYQNVYIAHSVLDAFNTVGNNSVTWMIVSPLNEEKLNQAHCLRLPLEVSAYSHILVTVLVNPEHLDQALEYYAFGALSVHSRQLTFNTFQEELSELMERLKAHPSVEQVIAEDVRRRLRKTADFTLLENFEESMLKKVDNSPAQRIRLIEARFLSQANLEAMVDIRKLSAEHPESQTELKKLAQKFLATSDIQTFRGPLGIKRVLILDPDSSQQQFVKSVFAELGADVIVVCDSLESGCEALEVQIPYDVIVTEWKGKDLKGHAFIQHVRHHGHEKQPIFIYSSLVKPEDHSLIEEISGVFIIQKPASKKGLKQALTETIERWNSPQEGEESSDKILNVLGAGKISEALLLDESFQKNPKVDRKLKDFVSASIAFHEGRFQDAKELILKNAKISVPNHKEISLLGKTLLRLGDSAAALKFLEQANQMVPGNIDRLCNLADANAGAGKPEKALLLAGEALKIGGDIDIVQSTFTKHAVAAGQSEQAAEYLESEETARDMIAFMNNLGIAHAAAQKWTESEKSYIDAIAALDGRHPQLLGIVSYNYGLSLARQGKLLDAITQLKSAENLAEPSLKRKAQDLRERAEKAHSSGQTLVLKEVMREIVAPRIGGPKTSLDDYRGRAKASLHGLFGVLRIPKIVVGLDLSSEMPKNVLRKDKEREEIEKSK